MEYKFKVGDKVKTTAHGHFGTITEVHKKCPQSDN